MSVLKSIKFRLTLWYLIAIVILLVVFGTVAYYLLSKNLYRNLDESLRARVIELEGSIKIEGSRVQFEQKVNELVMIYDADGALIQRLGPNVEFANIDKTVQRGPVRQELVRVRLDAQRAGRAALRGAVQRRFADARGHRRRAPAERHPEHAGHLPDGHPQLVAPAALSWPASGGLFLAERTLKPVERITDIARGIGESDLSRRIDIETDDELGRLSETLNEMIGRLEDAFMKQRQFVADASHELRTPLAVIQAESSLVLEKSRTEPEYRKALELVSQEVVLHVRHRRQAAAPGPERRRRPSRWTTRTSTSPACSRSSPRTSTCWPRTRA